MKPEPLSVLFLCTHNSARSVMAEMILNRLDPSRFRAFSAGSQPSGRINPSVAALLTRLGYDLSGARSKAWDEFAEPGALPIDIVITVCDSAAGETCPIWPGRPATAHWGFPDPSSATGTDAQKSAFTEGVYQAIEARLQAMVVLKLEAMSPAERQIALRALVDPTPEAAT